MRVAFQAAKSVPDINQGMKAFPLLQAAI